MSISINTNLNLLCSLFNVSSKKLSCEYSGMSIEEIMKAEAEQGNKAAENFDQTILNDPIKLIQLIQLNAPENKFAILSNMNESDLDNLLPLLSQDDLMAGLNFFSKDKLLKLLEGLPKAQLISYVFEMFSPEHMMSMMPEGAMNKVLESSDMSQYKGLQLKHLQSARPEILAQMIEAATGEQAMGVGNVGLDGKPSFDVKLMLEQLASLPDDQFQDALLSMPKTHKQNFMLSMAKDDPKIFEMFDASAYTGIIGAKKEKQDMIKAAGSIEKEQLVLMMQELPKDLTAVVLTQIDTEQFMAVLLSKFRDILGQIFAG